MPASGAADAETLDGARQSAPLTVGHYAVTVNLLNERYRWVATSAPALLTVNESHSERSVAYLAPSCRMQAVSPDASLRSPLEVGTR
jgi:hypothetical protein